MSLVNNVLCQCRAELHFSLCEALSNISMLGVLGVRFFHDFWVLMETWGVCELADIAYWLFITNISYLVMEHSFKIANLTRLNYTCEITVTNMKS